MTTAWEFLIATSTAPNGSTAWVHLMNQGTVTVNRVSGINVVTATMRRLAQVAAPVTAASATGVIAKVTQQSTTAKVTGSIQVKVD